MYSECNGDVMLCSVSVSRYKRACNNSVRLLWGASNNAAGLNCHSDR